MRHSARRLGFLPGPGMLGFRSCLRGVVNKYRTPTSPMCSCAGTVVSWYLGPCSEGLRSPLVPADSARLASVDCSLLAYTAVSCT